MALVMTLTIAGLCLIAFVIALVTLIVNRKRKPRD